MASSQERGWLAAFTKGSKALQKKIMAAHGHKPEFQKFLKDNGLQNTSSVKQVSKSQVDKVKEKARQALAAKAYGATKGTRMGGEDGGGQELRDTTVPLSPEQHSKVKAAERAAKPAKPVKEKKPRAKKAPTEKKPVDRMALLKQIASKKKINVPPVSAKQLRTIAAVGGQEHDHGGWDDLAGTGFEGRGGRSMDEAKDNREYDYEGDMAMSQLKSIVTNAQKLHDMIEPDTNLPEWVQSKITLAEDYVLTAANYMDSEMNEEAEQIDEVMNNRITKIHVRGQNVIVHRYDTEAKGTYKKVMHTHSPQAAQTWARQLHKARGRGAELVIGEEEKKDNSTMKNENVALSVLGLGKRGTAAEARAKRKAATATENDAPFSGPYKPKSSMTTDKSGAVHTGSSVARDLARRALKKIAQQKEEVEQIAEIEVKSKSVYELNPGMKEKLMAKYLKDKNATSTAPVDRMARMKARIAAYKAPVRANEEVEQVAEVNSRDSFIAAQARLTPRAKNVKDALSNTNRAKAATNKYGKVIGKIAGMKPKEVVANLKDMGEEVQQIDEVGNTPKGKAALASYIKKAAVALRKPNMDIARGVDVSKNINTVNKREMGMGAAAKRLAKEEAEQVSEVLKPSMGAGAYISDFVHSNNPKFAGKSKAERTKMALGAYYGAKKSMGEAKLDPVGGEDSDINNDGKHGHSTDKYLMNRRKKISSAIAATKGK